MATSGNYINENGIQMEKKSQEILHHVGNQKDAKLCQKCTKIQALLQGPMAAAKL